jgi:hypothetical protein
LSSDPDDAQRRKVVDVMRNRRANPNLMTLRLGHDRINLPPAERAEWSAFWEDVTKTLNTALVKPSPAPAANR